MRERKIVVFCLLGELVFVVMEIVVRMRKWLEGRVFGDGIFFEGGVRVGVGGGFVVFVFFVFF